MGAFFLVRKAAGENPAGREARLDAALGTQGFSAPKIIDDPDYVLHLYPKQVAPLKNAVVRPDGDFCACAGTFLYRNQVGVAALNAFLDDFRAGRAPDWDHMRGAYWLIVRKAGRTESFLDPLGTYKAYKLADESVVSSSFLACLAVLPVRKIDRQAVYEYLFQGATYGNDTVAKGIKLIDTPVAAPFDADVDDIGSLATHAALHNEHLAADFQGIARCFGDKIDTALSGGYDSRLTYAHLRREKVIPRLHVYGRRDDADVTVARTIADSLGIPLDHVDKSRTAPVPPDAFPDIVERNFQFFDGLPTDGIFDGGMDLKSRMMGCEDGRLALNGGGGEIFRNFFYLPDRAFSVRDLVWTFYSRFDPGVCRPPFSEADYHQRLGEKIRAALRIDHETLSRAEIEAVYPAFRCRFWTGRNTAINNRLGPALTPLVEYQTVRAAIRTPLKYKNFGRLEAEMIRSMDPELAAFPSAYGHAFDGPPSAGHIWKERLTYLRPPRLRRYSFRLRQRLSTPPRPFYLTIPYVKAALDTRFPVMNMFVDVPKIRDPEQLRRLATLEYFFTRTGDWA